MLDFTPKYHKEIGNYVKFIDEILHKCEKGIEFCKLCPNEFVCASLEQDDFGLEGTSVSHVLKEIKETLDKIPGYLTRDKREELEEFITRYINESPKEERCFWKRSILDTLLDGKLASQHYKPEESTNTIRTFLTYNNKISFSTQVKACLKMDEFQSKKDIVLSDNALSTIKSLVNPLINNFFGVSRNPSTEVLFIETNAKHILQKSNLNETWLAAALCYFTAITNSPVLSNIAVTGGLDNHGKVLDVTCIDNKIEVILRELHFIDTIIIPGDSSPAITVPRTINIITVDTLSQAIKALCKR